MKQTSTPACDIAYHKHFVETVHYAVHGVCVCLVGWVNAAGGVAFTLLCSGRWAGRLRRPWTRHPWKGSRRYRSDSGRHRLEEKGLRERSVAAANAR